MKSTEVSLKDRFMFLCGMNLTVIPMSFSIQRSAVDSLQEPGWAVFKWYLEVVLFGTLTWTTACFFWLSVVKCYTSQQLWRVYFNETFQYMKRLGPKDQEFYSLLHKKYTIKHFGLGHIYQHVTSMTNISFYHSVLYLLNYCDTTHKVNSINLCSVPHSHRNCKTKQILNHVLWRYLHN